MQYNTCYKCGSALTSGDVDGLCLNCKTQIHIPSLLAEFSALRAENARLKARVEAAEGVIEAIAEYTALYPAHIGAEYELKLHIASQKLQKIRKGQAGKHMRVIIHNADDTPETWECLRIAYADFVTGKFKDCGYRLQYNNRENFVIVHALRGKRDITLTVQSHHPKESA